MKLTFKKIKKRDIVFLDNNYLNLKLKKNIKIYFLNKNEINLRYLIKTFFKYLIFFWRSTFKEIYLAEVFYACKPKIVIGYAYNLLLFKLKRLFPNLKAKTIMYMHFAMRKIQFDDYKKLVKKGNLDYILINNPIEKNYLRKFITSNFIISGFVKNNEIQSNKSNKKKKFDIMIISEYRKNFNDKKKINSIKKISDFANKNNLKVCVALSSNRIDKNNISFKKEVSFYKSLGLDFYPEKTNSYLLAMKSKIIFCINSNLGYELIARKYRVFFVCEKKNIYLDKYPFISKVNDKNFYIKLNKLLNMSNTKFVKILIKSNIKFYFNPGNKILKSLIYKIIDKKFNENSSYCTY